MAKKPTPPPASDPARLAYKISQSEIWANVVNNLVRWGGLLGIAFYGYKIAASLAGETTAADIGINIATDFRISEALAWLLGGGGVAYGIGQRKLRKDVIERFSERQKTLESLIDPNRTSSELDPRGDNKPEDKL